MGDSYFPPLMAPFSRQSDRLGPAFCVQLALYLRSGAPFSAVFGGILLDFFFCLIAVLG